MLDNKKIIYGIIAALIITNITCLFMWKKTQDNYDKMTIQYEKAIKRAKDAELELAAANDELVQVQIELESLQSELEKLRNELSMTNDLLLFSTIF